MDALRWIILGVEAILFMGLTTSLYIWTANIKGYRLDVWRSARLSSFEEELLWIVAAEGLVMGLLSPIAIPAITYRYLFEKPSTSKGAVSMKKKLIFPIFWMVMGQAMPMMCGKAWEWYNAPPEPPSAEALKLIRSLEDVDGWFIDKRPGDAPTYLKRGEVRIQPHVLLADILVNESSCNNQFSWADSKAINNAASVCMRKLTAKAMDQSMRPREEFRR